MDTQDKLSELSNGIRYIKGLIESSGYYHSEVEHYEYVLSLLSVEYCMEVAQDIDTDSLEELMWTKGANLHLTRMELAEKDRLYTQWYGKLRPEEV